MADWLKALSLDKKQQRMEHSLNAEQLRKDRKYNKDYHNQGQAAIRQEMCKHEKK